MIIDDGAARTAPNLSRRADTPAGSKPTVSRRGTRGFPHSPRIVGDTGPLAAGRHLDIKNRCRLGFAAHDFLLRHQSSSGAGETGVGGALAQRRCVIVCQPATTAPAVRSRPPTGRACLAYSRCLSMPSNHRLIADSHGEP